LIRFASRHEIDDQKWDNCIQQAFNGNIYGYSWYLDIVALDWGALIEGDYERVFPLVFRKKLGFSYIYQPFFTQQLGLFSRKQLSAEILERFISAIPAQFKMAEINLNTHNNIQSAGIRIVPQLNHELDLIKTFEKIRAGYSENLLRNIKKAERSGLTISPNIKPDEVIRIFRENRGKEIGHLKDADYLRLNRLIYTCLFKKIADIRGVYDAKNQLVAGAFFIIANRKAIFLFSGLTPEGREAGAMPFLIDSFIRVHSGMHLTFDFDGSNDPNLARFYKSFGSRELVYQRIFLERSPGWFGAALKLYRRMKGR
jgi:hypothetical protein